MTFTKKENKEKHSEKRTKKQLVHILFSTNESELMISASLMYHKEPIIGCIYNSGRQIISEKFIYTPRLSTAYRI